MNDRRSVSVLLCFVVLLFTCVAHAQFRASIQGTVEDPNGAVITGATVRATNVETGLSRDAVTNETGFYRIGNLPPGRYSVVITAPGFKENRNDQVTVIAEQPRGYNARMVPGGEQTSVTVTADEGAALQTENAEISGTFNTTEVKRVPQFNRDPYELLRLAPGVFGTGARDAGGNSVSFPNNSGPGGSNQQVFQTENQVQVSANGQRVTANAYQIDGVNVNSQAWGGAAVITPNQESVKELRVVANSYSAENGRNSGATVQVVSQSGTNNFHGSAVVKRQTPGLNAYNRWSGPNGRTPARVGNRYTQWAGSVGGPIVKNRLFFFFSIEGVGSRQRSFDTGWIETPQWVSLIKTTRPNTIANSILQFPGMTPPNINKVLTFTCADLGVSDPTQCQSVSGGLDIGSPSGAVGTATGPTGGGLDGIPDVQFVELNSFSNSTSRQYNGRVDYQLTKSDLIAFSTYFVPTTNEFNAGWANGDRPYGNFTSDRRNMDGALLWTRTLSPTMVNEARFNVTRWYFNEIESNSGYPWGIPQSGVGAGSQRIQYGPFNPGVFYQTTYNFRDTLSKVWRAHALRFGADIAKEQNNDRIVWAARPSYEFANLWSFANDAPFQESGNFNIKTGQPTDVRKGIRTGDYAAFVQDDWKARPNLTINLGLRWEYFQPLHTKNEPLTNVILGPGGSITNARLVTTNDLYKGDFNNWGPQIGFAWSPWADAKTVFRGGYGLGYNRIPESLTLNARVNPGVFAGFTFTGNQVLYKLPSDIKSFYGFPANPNAVLSVDPNTGFPNLPNQAKPNIEFGTFQNVPIPYTHRYSLDFEHDMGGDWIASLGYQGSSSRKLPRRVNYNWFVTPNPNLGNVNWMFTDVNSNYNALLTSVRHRFARAFSLNVQYRWAKSMDHCSNDDNCVQTYPFAQQYEWGPSDYDVTHSLQAYGTWTLPVFRGRKDVLETVLGGWEISGALTANSGFPWTPVYGGAACVVQRAGGNICPVRPIAYNGGGNLDYSTENFQGAGLFPQGGTAYFTPPPAGAFTASSIPGVGRNSFRGPRYFSTDLAFTKRFTIPKTAILGEAAGLEFRAQAFNLFNKLNLRPFGFNTPNTQIDNTNFGKATDALAGRVVEFQARFNF